MTKEYMPEVGTVCEYFWSEGKEWRKCEVIAVHNSKIIVADYEGIAYEGINPMLNRLRPLKTQQEIEREEAILDLYVLINQYASPAANASMICDAGYRKVGDEVSVEFMSTELQHNHALMALMMQWV